MIEMWMGVGVLLAAAAGVVVFLAICFRRVVATNEVHIVQSAKRTTSYGKDTTNGNTYYQWPSWIPLFGIQRMILPVSNFDVDLSGYEAYDKGRLPFVVDVKAFFRIKLSDVAAQRVSSFSELHEQLKAIVQGAVRTILASSEIEDIMQGRSTFGEMFTKEVSDQLANWGVETVKNIELMDIRDSHDSHVIHNIMAKKKSHIEMESRTEVAKNKKLAQVSEIEAQREVDLQVQQATQQVGLRTIEAERHVAIAGQEKEQAVKEHTKLTREKEMAVIKIEQVRQAEITKEVEIVKADQAKQVTMTIAEGELKATKREAEGIAVHGEATASAKRALELAPVQAQITLAKEIGSNKEYQSYLVTVRQVEAEQAVGIAQAVALEKANIKIIANSDKPSDGLTGAHDLFNSGTGVKLGSMLEGLVSTPTGKKVVSKYLGERAGTDA